MVVESLYTI